MTGLSSRGSPQKPFLRLDRKGLARYVLMAASIVVFVALWWLAAELFHKPYLPTPPAVLEAFLKSFKSDPATGIPMLQQVVNSLMRFLLGFGLALILALPIGLIMGFFWAGDALGKPVVEILRPIPPIAWVPLLLLAFGFFLGPVITIFLGAFFPILSNVIFGVRSVDKSLMDAAKTLGAGKLGMFRRVIIPFTVPFLMTGVTIGLGIAWMCIVAAEMLGVRGGGVGAVIIENSNLGLYSYMFAGMVMIAILGIVTVGSSRFIEKRISIWMGMA